MATRKIAKKYSGQPVLEGAGVRLTRIFAHADVYDLDPFLLLDFFKSDDPEDYIKGFPWHPHRGIETITYLVEGLLEHGDSLGNKGVIEPLGCQWMTAGKGILHQEMPQPTEYLLGAQLWLNLPKAHKMTEPEYRDITVDDLMIVEDGNVHVKVIAGIYDGQKGPVRGTYVDPVYLDVTIKPSGTFTYQLPEEDTVFLLLLEGSLRIGEDVVNVDEARGVLLDEGAEIEVSSKNGARFLLMAGCPLGDPIAWGGPIVMNTQEELRHAFAQIRNGTFIEK
ncbi:MAG: pirin family protein [Chloroflexi bacterium]|nr:pirin family protein [Chloroflexota bacterium]